MRNDKVLRRIKNGLVKFFNRVAGDNIEPADTRYVFPVQFDFIRFVRFHVRRIDFKNVPADTEIPAVKHRVIPLVLERNKLGGKRADVEFFPDFNVNAHIAVQIRHSQSVNARNGRNDDNVAPFHKTVRRGKAQFVYFLIDCRVLFDVEVARRNVGFRLVIIVVGNKIFDGVVREKSLELAVELGGKRFVVAYDERRTLHTFNDFCHRKRFSASGNAFERLVAVAA